MGSICDPQCGQHVASVRTLIRRGLKFPVPSFHKLPSHSGHLTIFRHSVTVNTQQMIIGTPKNTAIAQFSDSEVPGTRLIAISVPIADNIVRPDRTWAATTSLQWSSDLVILPMFPEPDRTSTPSRALRDTVHQRNSSAAVHGNTGILAAYVVPARHSADEKGNQRQLPGVSVTSRSIISGTPSMNGCESVAGSICRALRTGLLE